MALSCGTQFIKYLLFIFNVLVFLFGVLITGFGIYFIVEAKNSLSSQAVGVPAFILTLGLLLFLIGVLGCCGACKEHTCMLKTFAAIIIILLILQIVAGILVFIYRSKFVEMVGDGIAAQISKMDSLSENEQKNLRRALNALQKKLHCCGGKGPADWGNSAPPSCCEEEKSPCSEPYNLGCAQATYDLLKDKALIVGIVLVCMAIIQFGAIISACCLARKIEAQTAV